MTSLIDTNVLVYRIDPRYPAKQREAEARLRAGQIDGSVVLAHQCLVEFVAAAIRPRQDLGGASLLTPADARLVAERLMSEFPVHYPDEAVVRMALRGTAMYGLSWFDAHLWAYAEVNEIDEILSEDFEHGRHYGNVRAVNPFLAADGVHELPPLYDAEELVRAERGASPLGRRRRGGNRPA